MLTDSFKELDALFLLKNSHTTAGNYRYVVYKALNHMQQLLSAHGEFREEDCEKEQRLENLFTFYNNIYKAGAKKKKDLGALLDDQFYLLTYRTEKEAKEGIETYYNLSLEIATEYTAEVLHSEEKVITEDDHLMCFYFKRQVEFWRRLQALWGLKWNIKLMEVKGF